MPFKEKQALGGLGRGSSHRSLGRATEVWGYRPEVERYLNMHKTLCSIPRTKRWARAEQPWGNNLRRLAPLCVFYKPRRLSSLACFSEVIKSVFHSSGQHIGYKTVLGHWGPRTYLSFLLRKTSLINGWWKMVSRFGWNHQQHTLRPRVELEEPGASPWSQPPHSTESRPQAPPWLQRFRI